MPSSCTPSRSVPAPWQSCLSCQPDRSYLSGYVTSPITTQIPSPLSGPKPHGISCKRSLALTAIYAANRCNTKLGDKLYKKNNIARTRIIPHTVAGQDSHPGEGCGSLPASPALSIARVFHHLSRCGGAANAACGIHPAKLACLRRAILDPVKMATYFYWVSKFRDGSLRYETARHLG